VLGIRNPQQAASAVRREEELPVGVEHAVLDDQWGGRPGQVLRIVERSRIR